MLNCGNIIPRLPWGAKTSLSLSQNLNGVKADKLAHNEQANITIQCMNMNGDWTISVFNLRILQRSLFLACHEYIYSKVYFFITYLSCRTAGQAH